MTSNAMEPQSRPMIVKWLLDTRALWAVPKMQSPRDEVQELKAVASKALGLLSLEEQASVLKYYFVKDAKMSLGSHLLKHLVITKYCNAPWAESKISRDNHGKPCFKTTNPNDHVVMDFNVSHQAGIVSLVASIGFSEKVDVGTDVVCADERLKHDNAHIEKDGFYDWVDMHGDVFAESELNHMKLSPVRIYLDGAQEKFQGYAKDAISRIQRRSQSYDIKIPAEDRSQETIHISGSPVIDKKLRRFYAMWCLRETYVKMTGEALLAPWLKDLEITGAESPAPNPLRPENGSSLEHGEVEKAFKIFFKRKLVNDVRMELTALGSNYMVGAAIRLPKDMDDSNIDISSEWKWLDIEKDVLDFAEPH